MCWRWSQFMYLSCICTHCHLRITVGDSGYLCFCDVFRALINFLVCYLINKYISHLIIQQPLLNVLRLVQSCL